MSSPPSRSKALRVLILGGSTEATALASRRSPAAPPSLRRCRWQGRVREPAPQTAADTRRRLRRRRGIGGLPARPSASTCWSTPRILSPRPCRPAPTRGGARGRRPAARGRGAGRGAPRRAIVGLRWRRWPRRRRRWARCPRRVFLTIGRLHLAAFAGDIAAPLSRALHRFRRRRSRAGRCRLRHHAGTVRRRGRDRADARSSASRCSSPRTAAASASHAKIVAARELGLPVLLVRPPAGGDDRLGVADALTGDRGADVKTGSPFSRLREKVARRSRVG